MKSNLIALALASVAAATSKIQSYSTSQPAVQADSAIQPAVQADWDVIVVGGGPAGLAAASALGRVRRKTLVVDSGEYRNAATRRIHDVLGFDGVTPAYFRWRARQQISEYSSVIFNNGTVQSIKPSGASGELDHTRFTVSIQYAPGTASAIHTARKIVLATGIKDRIPSTPGLEENFGKGIYWCPWCDGYEHLDQPLGVLGPLDKAATTPLEILSLNKDVVIFANGTDTPAARAVAEKKLPNFEEWLQIHNVTIENRTITSVQRLADAGPLNEDPSRATLPEHDLFQVNFDEGAPVERAVFVTNWEKEQRSKLGEETGVKIYDGKLYADFANGMATNIAGIYAVGDANTDNSTNVPHAMWSGKRAVVSLHVNLEKENAEYQVANLSRRDLESRERQIWARINRDDDVMHVGDYKLW